MFQGTIPRTNNLSSLLLDRLTVALSEVALLAAFRIEEAIATIVRLRAKIAAIALLAAGPAVRGTVIAFFGPIDDTVAAMRAEGARRGAATIGGIVVAGAIVAFLVGRGHAVAAHLDERSASIALTGQHTRGLGAGPDFRTGVAGLDLAHARAAIAAFRVAIVAALPTSAQAIATDGHARSPGQGTPPSDLDARAIARAPVAACAVSVIAGLRGEADAVTAEWSTGLAENRARPSGFYLAGPVAAIA